MPKRRRSETTSSPVVIKMVQSNGDGSTTVTDAFEVALQDVHNTPLTYSDTRRDILESEQANLWYSSVLKTASEAELQAAFIVWKIREDDRENFFGNRASEAVPGPDTQDLGGQFLTNLERIEKSRLFKIALRMPKGAHLHLHFNAELPPGPLLKRARDVPTMRIRSTQSITTVEDIKDTEIVFSVMPDDTVEADLFSLNYDPEFKKEGSRPWMKWSTFQKVFKDRFDLDAEVWAADKMVLNEEEVYGMQQTTNG